MKKIIMAAAIICAAVYAQAASCNWMASAFGTYDNVASQDYMFNWAIVDLGTSAEIDISKISYDGETVKLGDKALTTIQSGEADGWGMLGQGDSYTAGNYYTMVIWDQQNENFGVGAVVQGALDPTPGATGLTDMVFDNATGINIDNDGTYSGIVAVPEPTSGLLMLVGLAGLALRRRRA
jgi:hypothetical protein